MWSDFEGGRLASGNEKVVRSLWNDDTIGESGLNKRERKRKEEIEKR